jgi:hypothetical protein
VAICALESKPAGDDAKLVLEEENHDKEEEKGKEAISDTDEDFPNKFQQLELFFSDLSTDYGRLDIFKKVRRM